MFGMVALIALVLDSVVQIDVPRRPPIPLNETPHVVVKTYEITGDLARDLHIEMDLKGPMTSRGERVPARTEWRNQVRWMNDGTGCVPSSAELTWQIETTLPALAADAEAGPRMRERWNAYLLQIEAFEYGRAIRINQGMEAMLAAMRAASDCDGLTAARRAGEQAIVDANARYDAETLRARRAIRPLR